MNSLLQHAWEHAADVTRIFVWPRIVGVIIGILVAAGWFYYKNPKQRLPVPFFAAPEYLFYSGPRGGEFSSVGQWIDRRDTSDVHHAFSVELAPTSGSLENAQNVATTSKALALVGEVTGSSEAIPTQKLLYVAPIYMPKVQPPYRKSRLADLLRTCGTAAEREQGAAAEIQGPLRLTDHMHPCVRQALASMRLHAGPSGSGTRLVASYLWSSIGVRPIWTRSGDFVEEFQALKRRTIDMAFVFSAPLSRSRAALATDPDLALAEIDPAVVTSLRKMFGIDLVPTTLSELHAAGREESDADTIGAYAWLVTSPDVPPEHVAVFLRWLAEYDVAKGNLRTNLPRVAETFDAAASERKWEFIRLACAFMLVFGYLGSWTVSHVKRVRFLRKYAKLRESASAMMRAEAGRFTSATALDDLNAHATELENNLSAINAAFVRGLLSVKHRDGLTGLFEHLEKKLVIVCKFHLRMIARHNGPDAVIKRADRWFERGYIDQNEYDSLVHSVPAKQNVSQPVPA